MKEKIELPKKTKIDLALEKRKSNPEDILNKYPQLEEALDIIIKEDARDLKEKRDAGYISRIINKYDELKDHEPFKKGTKTELEYKELYKDIQLAIIVLMEKKGIVYNQHMLDTYFKTDYETMMAREDQAAESSQAPAKPVEEDWLKKHEEKQDKAPEVELKK